MRTQLDDALQNYFQIPVFYELPERIERRGINVAPLNNNNPLVTETIAIRGILESVATYSLDGNEGGLKIQYNQLQTNTGILLDKYKVVLYELNTQLKDEQKHNFKTLLQEIIDCCNNLLKLSNNAKECLEWLDWPKQDELERISWKQELDPGILIELEKGNPYYHDQGLSEKEEIEEESLNVVLLKSQSGAYYFEKDSTKYYLKPAEYAIENLKWEALDTTRLFRDQKEASCRDVQQGAMGDCFLMASMISLAYDEDVFFERKILQIPDTSIVFVKLFKKNALGRFTPIYVKVDCNVVHFVTNSKVAVYGDTLASFKRALWPVIIEKAYAIYKSKKGQGQPNNVLSQSNEANRDALKFLNGGESEDSMQILTGKFYDSFKFESRSNQSYYTDITNYDLWSAQQKEAASELYTKINGQWLPYRSRTNTNDLDYENIKFWKDVIPNDWKEQNSNEAKIVEMNSWCDFLMRDEITSFLSDRITNNRSPRIKLEESDFINLLKGTAKYKYTKDKVGTIIGKGLKSEKCREWLNIWLHKSKLFLVKAPNEIIFTSEQLSTKEKLKEYILNNDYPLLTTPNIAENTGKYILESHVYPVILEENDNFWLIDSNGKMTEKKTASYPAFLHYLEKHNWNKRMDVRNLNISSYEMLSWFDRYTLLNKEV